ncbi:transglycosylase domain-containing protein [Actinoplanes sp. N902-109]|uniref:transglycosylase domain-containing protein n=1 Tax=Actinoplanes sp. (strain N902-109) TaxID=649831 RepID=UPI0003293DD0|nr:transglycosylase domain-containing protein [Actinoplanes sp. N902-109]AGL18986.1 peptidoglycan glycosyltransferase [Actinoplanes sp. N902-109]
MAWSAVTRSRQLLQRTLIRRWRWLPRWCRRTVAALAVLSVALVVAGAGYVAGVDLPPEPAPPQASVLYYRDGHTVLARIGTTDRTDITLDKVPVPVRQAFLAAEDRGFYDHFGVSVRGLARALWTNIAHDSGQGASTITQQYVRNAYLTQDRTVSRKSKEAALALKVEHRYSKDQILERYLNTIYFGRGAYGIEAAARAFFGTGVDHLNASQGAVLAAMVKDPTRGDPAVDAAWAKDRWAWILRSMSEQGWLAPDAAAQLPYPAVATQSVTANTISGPTGLITDRVEDELVRAGISRQQIRIGGLRVVTTIDATAQSEATAAIGTALKGQPKQLRSALVAVDPADGGVRAYYGGDRGRGYFDDAVAARPPASTFKPLVLAAAEERDISFASLYNGTSPRLFPDRGGAPLYNQGNLQCPICPLDTAMVYSLNTPYYALAQQIGADNVRGLAHRLGVPEAYGKQKTLVDAKGEPRPGQTRSDIALGRYPVTPADMATVYATLASGGRRTARHFIGKVTTAGGTLLYKAGTSAERVMSGDVAADVGTVLAKVVDHNGTVPGLPAAAKTGSQQWADSTDSSDAWTAGWAPGLAAVVWVGREQPGPIRTKDGDAINGDGMPYEIWQKFLAGALRGQPARAMAGPAMVGRRDGTDLKTLAGAEIKKRAGEVYPGPQKGDKVDKSKATGSWSERVARLDEALTKYAAGQDFAVSVVDRRTGHKYAFHGDDPFESASVIKVELLAALLLKAQDEHRDLTAKERARATKMIRASDNAAAKQLYDAIGGPSALLDACRRLGLHDTQPAASLGLTLTTAKDQTRMTGALTAGAGPLTKGSKEYLLQLMSSVNADQSWGVSATAFDGEHTALKNGWLARTAEDNKWIVNSTGRVSGEKVDVSLSVLSHGHAGQQDGIDFVEEVAALTRSYLGW